MMSRLLSLVALAAIACGDEPGLGTPDAALDAASDGPRSCDSERGTLHDRVLPVGDLETRTYFLHVPSSVDCRTPAPLLVDFHGTAGGTRPEEAYQTDALIAFAEAHGVIVARPRSRSRPWQGGEIYQWDVNPGDLDRNVAFAKGLVEDLSVRYAIDPARIYASGFSSGANMVAQFLTTSSSPFAGLAPIAGGRWTQQPLPSLATGPRVYMATGYRDYLWTTARSLITQLGTAGLPAERLHVARTGGGHELYAWHFEELWQFLDSGTRPATGTVAAPWTATTLPSASDVLAFAVDGGALHAAGARGRIWNRSFAGEWGVEMDRGTPDFTALCFGPSRGFVGGSYTGAHYDVDLETWGPSGTIPDYGGQLGNGWINTALCRDDDSLVVAGYWSAAMQAAGAATWSRFSMPSAFAGVDTQAAGGAQAPGGETVLVGYYNWIGRAPRTATSTDVSDHGLDQVDWFNAAAAATGGLFWVVGEHGTIAASVDGGQTWFEQTSNTTEDLYAVHFSGSQHGAAVGRNGTVVVTSNGGSTWTPRPLGKRVFLGAVHVEATTITVAGEDGLVATSPR